MFERRKRQNCAQQLFSTVEEAMFFEQAAKEVAAEEIHTGLRAMAISKCEGDEVKANGMYLQLRVEMLKQEAALGECVMDATRTGIEKSSDAHEEFFNVMVIPIGAVVVLGLLFAIAS
jgi:hypothetical protein